MSLIAIWWLVRLSPFTNRTRRHGSNLWICTTAQGLQTGDQIEFAASGNFIAKRTVFDHEKFDIQFGLTGGSDTELFLRLFDRGFRLVWCDEAFVSEDIPSNRSSTGYMIRRFITQGSNYATILLFRGRIRSILKFRLRAVFVSILFVPLGLILIPFAPGAAASALKRGFSNFGKIYTPRKVFYGEGRN